MQRTEEQHRFKKVKMLGREDIKILVISVVLEFVAIVVIHAILPEFLNHFAARITFANTRTEPAPRRTPANVLHPPLRIRSNTMIKMACRMRGDLVPGCAAQLDLERFSKRRRFPQDTDDEGWLLLEDEMGRHHGWTADYTETWVMRGLPLRGRCS